MDALFTALADPTRRSVLDRLRAGGPMTLTALAAPMPMTRQAVTKHVDALAAAGLVTVKRVGRERVHELRPQPLEQVEDWLRPYAEFWDRRLEALRAHLEDDDR